MDKAIAKADKEVLAEIVRLAQKQGLKGAKGGWKDFLKCQDKKLGTCLSDPAKRSKDILVAFLKTFTKDEQRLFRKMIRRFGDQNVIKQFIKDFPDLESPQQKLVRLTVEHSQYVQHYSFPFYNEGWVNTRIGKISEAMKSQAMVAIDCEMVLCSDGTEAVARVCVVDHNLEVKLDELVNPNKAVADYRTHITGVSPEDLQGITCSLEEIQIYLKKLLSHGTILVGHSLHNDLRALKLDHQRVIDTSYIFKYTDLHTVSPSLNNLCQVVLGYPVRKDGEPHDCLNDARTAMKLVLAKLEAQFENPIAITGNNPPNSDLAKLLLHRIPVDVPSEELLKLFSGSYNINVESGLMVRGEFYSTYAVFKDANKAVDAFREIEGQDKKDSSGRPQKHVFLKLSSGKAIRFYVRLMTVGVPHINTGSSKRLSQDMAEDETNHQEGYDAIGLKRQRMCLYPCEHIKEIERLKQEVREREDEIYNLQKILSVVTRKHGF